jgi:hypothetical protein
MTCHCIEMRVHDVTERNPRPSATAGHMLVAVITARLARAADEITLDFSDAANWQATTGLSRSRLGAKPCALVTSRMRLSHLWRLDMSKRGRSGITLEVRAMCSGHAAATKQKDASPSSGDADRNPVEWSGVA